jgi:phosphatidylglycerol---prolipoprotein diacylglyceryl transferase
MTTTLIMPYRPVAFELMGWEVRWYGLFFAFGLAAVWILMRLSARSRGDVAVDHVDGAMFWISIGAVLGGRVGEILLFAPLNYFSNTSEVFNLSSGGMSFHGGLVGVSIAVYLYHLSSGVDLWRLADLASSAAPIGLLLGRIGNFLNGELYGPETALPWGIVFPLAGNSPRHPTQLYEMLAEGFLLLLALYPLARLRVFVGRPGVIFGLFLILYAIVRIAIEPLRLDGWSIKLLETRISAGQLYCMPMLLLGALVVTMRLRRGVR